MEERNIAAKAAVAAGLLCRRIQVESVTGETLQKRDRSPVTVADFSSQAVICSMLGDSFPGIPIVAEEDSAELVRPENEAILERVVRYVGNVLPGVTADDVLRSIDLGGGEPQGRYWTLDPIDGTKGFIRGDQYAVALALVEGGVVRVGVLACPNLPFSPDGKDSKRGTIFVAVRGEGAMACPLDGGGMKRIRVSPVSSPGEARMVESVESGHANHDGQAAVAARLGMEREPVRMDSQAKYGVVALGEAEIYLRLPSPGSPDYREKIWDHAAGMIVVEEAGGKVTDIYGKPLDFSRGRLLAGNRGVVVSNGRFHEEVIGAIRR